MISDLNTQCGALLGRVDAISRLAGVEARVESDGACYLQRVILDVVKHSIVLNIVYRRAILQPPNLQILQISRHNDCTDNRQQVPQIFLVTNHRTWASSGSVRAVQTNLA